MSKVMFYWNLPFPLQIVNIELLQFPNKNLFQGKSYMSSKAALMKYWSYQANLQCIQRHFNINFVGIFYCSHYNHDKIITSTVHSFPQRQRESHRPQHREPCPTLLQKCVGGLMSHTNAVRQGLWFIVLIQKDQKV